MHFDHFRIFLTLVVSFGPFFAYICRLNLSMAIEKMVVDRPWNEASSLNVDDTIGLERQIASEYSSPRTEEHTLALMFGFRTAVDRRVKSIKRQKLNRTREGLKQVPIFPVDRDTRQLTVDFKIDQQEPSSIQTTTQNPKPTSESQPDDSISIDVVDDSLLNWTKEDKDFLLSSYFLGYVIFQTPAARMAEVFGAKPMFLAVGFGTGICSIIFPLACKLSLMYAVGLRIALGAIQSGLFPAAYVLLCEWLPKNERSKWLPWPSSFSRIGTIVMNILIPIVINMYSWQWVFYISGGAALVWSVIFLIVGSNTPDQSYWISERELIYIESHMEPRVGTLAPTSKTMTASGFTINESGNERLTKPSISWTKLCCNKAVLILSLVMFTSEWSNMLLLVKLPGFLGPVLQMDLTEIGFWSSILIAIYCVHYPLSGFCASVMENSSIEWMTPLRVRKIFEASEFTAHLLQGAGALAIAFYQDKTVILVALMFMMLGRATVGGGQCLMPPELSKDYPGTVFAYANSLANLAGFFGPIILTFMVQEPKSHDSWFSLWVLSAGIFFAGGLVFCLFAENGPQNYCKKPKMRTPSTSLSQAQLTSGKQIEEPEIFKMEAFARVTSETSGKALPSEERQGTTGSFGRRK